MALLLTVGSLFATATTAERNIAYSDAEVRFTVITPGTVRLEYAPDGKFVDNKSLMAVNREYEKTDYKVKVGSWVEITTPVLRLRYKKGSGAFTDKNLVITSSNKQKGNGLILKIANMIAIAVRDFSPPLYNDIF